MNLLPFQSSWASWNEIYYRNCPYPTTRLWLHEGEWGKRVWNLQEYSLHSEWLKGWGFSVPGVPAPDDVSAKAGTCWPDKETVIEAIWSRGKEGWQDRLVRAHGCRAYLGLSHLPRWHTLKRDCGKGNPSSRDMCWCLSYWVTVGLLSQATVQWGVHGFLQDAHMPMVRSTGRNTSCSLQLILYASVT